MEITVYEDNDPGQPREITPREAAERALNELSDDRPPMQAINIVCAEIGSFDPNTEEYRTFETKAADLLRRKRKSGKGTHTKAEAEDALEEGKTVYVHTFNGKKRVGGFNSRGWAVCPDANAGLGCSYAASGRSFFVEE